MTSFTVDWTSWNSFVESLSVAVALRLGMWLAIGCVTGFCLTFVVRSLGRGRALIGGALAGLVAGFAFLLGAPPLGEMAGHIAAAGLLGLCLALMVTRSVNRSKAATQEKSLAPENQVALSPVPAPPPPVEAKPAPKAPKPMQTAPAKPAPAEPPEPAAEKPAPQDPEPEEPAPDPTPKPEAEAAPSPDPQPTPGNGSTKPQPEAEAKPAAAPPPPKKPSTPPALKPMAPPTETTTGGGLDWLKDHS